MSDESAVTIVETGESDLPRLSEREALFLSHYLNDRPLFHATNSALAMGMGYSYDVAANLGARIKNRPHVQAHIRAYIADLGMTRERIAANLAAIANADWRDLVEVKVNRVTGETVSVRMDLSSCVKANELLGREVGMFTEKVDHTVEVVPKRYIGVDLDKV